MIFVQYNDDEYYDEYTPTRVYRCLREAGATLEIAQDAIAIMQRDGILFRERKM